MIKPIRQWVILFFLVIAAYGPGILGSFHYDDFHSIVDNSAVHSLKNIVALWTDSSTSSILYENRNYRPLTFTFYSLCWMLGQGTPLFFHLFMLLFHFAVVLGLYEMLKILLRLLGQANSRLAFILAAFFAIHPACAETVNYLTAATSLLCAVFYIWSFNFYLLWREKPKTPILLLSLLFYFLACASKEEGITLPAVVLMTEVFLEVQAGHTLRWKRLLVFWPFLTAGVVLGVWLYQMHPEAGNISRGTRSSWEYFMTQWKAYLWYMKVLFWPSGLNIDHVSFRFAQSLSEPSVLLALAGNLSLLMAAWILRARVPGVFLGLLWFYVTISPASSVVVLGEAVNEHRMYLAYLGLLLSVGSLLSFFFKNYIQSMRLDLKLRSFRVTAGIGVILFATFFVLTQQRNQVWATDEALWKDALEKNPGSGRALNNVAISYTEKGETEKAIEIYERCAVEFPDYISCPLNLGAIYLEQLLELKEKGQFNPQDSRLKQVEELLLKAHRINPVNTHTLYYLGRVYEGLYGDCSRAESFYFKALQFSNRRYSKALIGLSRCYFKAGNQNEAKHLLNDAALLTPN